MSNNLLKAWHVSPNPEEEIRVIDNNEVIAKRLEWLASQDIIPETADGKAEDENGTEQSVSREAQLLLGEDPGEADETGGFVQGIFAEQVEVPAGPDPQELVRQAQAEAERILEEAQAQAEAVRLNAVEEGRQQGYADGLQESRVKMQEAEERITEKAEALEAAYWNKVEELEPAFVDTLTGIYEHIFHVKLSTEKQLILNLLSEAMRGIENCREFMIHVSAEDAPAVRAAKQTLLEAACAPDARVDIVEDVTLSGNECLIETGSGIFDCSLDTQLEELRRQLKLLSYEK